MTNITAFMPPLDYRDDLREALTILERDKNPASRNAIAVIEKWATDANVYF